MNKHKKNIKFLILILWLKIFGKILVKALEKKKL